MATLLLIDGHSQAYRAYFGVKTPLITRRGELTTAVFGFVRKLLSVMREYQPDYVAVAFDLGETWRHDEYPEYKATRERMPDDLGSQIDRIQQVLGALAIPILTREGYEADDVLGSLARRAADKGLDVLILTGDRDMFQLIDDRVKILYTSGGPSPQTSVYDLDAVAERYAGLTPDQFLEMKALVGDTSDNIPGIPGVGEKTAIRFLKSYETLDGLYEHVDEVRGPKTQQNVRDAEEQIRRNVRLVTITTDLDLPLDLDSLRVKDADPIRVRQIFEELEFMSFLRELNLDSSTPSADSSGQLALFGDEPETGPNDEEHPYICVRTEEDLTALLSQLDAATILSFDVETTSTDPTRADLVGLGVAWEKEGGAYVPVGHQEGEQLDWIQVRSALAPYFGNPALPKVAHNAKYDAMVLERHGLELAGDIHDTMTMAWILDPASRALGLKSLALYRLGWQMTDISELIGKGRKQITIDRVEVDRVTAYCGADVDATIQLYQLLEPALRESGMWQLYEEIELPLLPVLADMEMAGVLVDREFLQELSRSLGDRLAACTERLYEIVGEAFNLRSTQQLSTIMFERMGFPTDRLSRTRSGFVSTAVSELEKLQENEDSLSKEQAEFLSLLFEQRQLEKLRGTYVDALPELINPETGRLHTSFNQTGSSTGRLSSSNPNLQNIPIRTEQGREIRKAFVAPPGWLLLAADYSQVELRILAHVTGETLLREAFLEEKDIHAVTASRLFSLPLEEVGYEERTLGKTINFATIYGISAFGLSSRTNMDPAQAQRFLDQYFETYPAVNQYLEQTKEMAANEGYVETLLGRKRFFPELKEGVPFRQRTALERAAINAPIQGTAADIIKIAMIRLHRRLQEEKLRGRMLLQVHDELVLEVPAEELSQTRDLVCEVMESAYSMSVPLKVDVESGPNWYEMEGTD